MARGVNKAIIIGTLGQDPEVKYTAGRVNAGFSVDYGRYFGNLAWNYTDEAFWTSFVSGATDSFTSLNATFGIRWPNQGVTLMLGGTNLTNDTIQHHIIGDVFRRQFTARLRLAF